MTVWTERGNIKRIPSCVTRDVMVQASIIKANTRRHFVTTMAFVTKTLMSATLFNLAGNTFSPLTVLRNSKGSGRSCSLKTPKGAQKDAA